MVTVGLACAALMVMGVGCGGNQDAPLDDGGVFKSNDGGATWEQKATYLSSQGVGNIKRVDAIRLVIDPTDHRTIYAGTLENGMLYSIDEGESWQHVRDITSGIVREVIIDPQNRCSLFIAWQDKIMHSGDCARTVDALYDVPQSGVEVRTLAIHPNNSDVLFAGLSNGHLLRSEDGGATWRLVHDFKDLVTRFEINPRTPSIMYGVLMKRGLVRSIDAGASWERLNQKMAGTVSSAAKNNFDAGYDVALDPSNTSVVYFATKVGIVKSIDDGESWDIVPILTSPGEARIWELTISPHDPKVVYYSATLGTRAVLYKTEDGGETWDIKKTPTTRIPLSVALDPETDGRVYFGTYYRPPEN